LSSLVQGLEKNKNSTMKVEGVPSTLIWGSKDYTHRETRSESIKEHLPNCEVIEFHMSGHFPELEETDRYVHLIHERMELS